MSLAADAPTAASVVVDYLSHQVSVLRRLEAALARGSPEAVHDTRVATRRIRSTLKTFGGLLGVGDLDRLLEDLRWWGTVVGARRDAQVLHLRWQPMLAELADVVAADGVSWLDAELGARAEAAMVDLRVAMGSDRHAGLRDRLSSVGAAGTLSPEGARPAGDVLPHLVRRACRRMDRAARRAEAAETEHARTHRLHQVRKSAKRARYAAELCAPVLGAPATDLAERMESLQEVLGERQDSAKAQEVLLELMAAPGTKGPEGFVCGALWSAERQLADAAEEFYDLALTRAGEREVRHWLG